MKKLLLASAVLLTFSLSLVIFNLSCNRPAEAQQTNNYCLGPQPKLQFKLNGVVQNCDAVFSPLVGWDKCPLLEGAGTTWSLFGFSGRTLSGDGGFELKLSGSPSIKTYLDSRPRVRDYNTFYEVGNYTVTITSISNNRASGTFSGQVRNLSGSATAQITEGVFTDVPIGYFDWGIRN